MRGCVCVYLSAVFQSEFIRLKAYLTMNSLLKSHSSTCSFLELILAQQELYLKVTAEYWMLSRKVGKVRPEAWSLIEGLLKCRGKLWGEGLELTFLSPTPTPRMLKGWEGQAAGDPYAESESKESSARSSVFSLRSQVGPRPGMSGSPTSTGAGPSRRPGRMHEAARGYLLLEGGPAPRRSGQSNTD